MRLFDTLLAPLGGLTPAAAMVVICAAVGLLTAIVFRAATNRRKVAGAANRAIAELLAVRLFRHDPLAMLRAELRMIRAIGRRLWLTLPATLILAVPLIVLLVALAPRFERRALRPGESAVLEVNAWYWKDVQPAESTGVAFETPALRDDLRETVSWRVRATGDRPATLNLTVSQYAVALPVDIGAHPELRLLRRVAPTDPLPGPLRSVTLHYPRREFVLMGIGAPWWLVFALGSMLFAWLFGKALGVRY